MRAHLRPTLTLLVVLTVLTGIGYPLAVTGIAYTAFPDSARGSVLVVDGRVVGSRHVGQRFEGARWMIGRPSAAGSHPYDARSSAGSNLGPSSPRLDSLVRARVATVRQREGVPDTVRVPVDLVTSSGSGLDPHLSPRAAALQVPRIAQVRGLPPDSVHAIVRRATTPRLAGVYGHPHVNVLLVNLMLEGVALDSSGASP